MTKSLIESPLSDRMTREACMQRRDKLLQVIGSPPDGCEFEIKHLTRYRGGCQLIASYEDSNEQARLYVMQCKHWVSHGEGQSGGRGI